MERANIGQISYNVSGPVTECTDSLMLESLLTSEWISALLAFAIVLIPAIIVHEFGHYFAANAAGIRILEFGIGIPPRLCRLFRWRGTLFTLNWLPLGGFVLAARRRSPATTE